MSTHVAIKYSNQSQPLTGLTLHPDGYIYDNDPTDIVNCYNDITIEAVGMGGNEDNHVRIKDCLFTGCVNLTCIYFPYYLEYIGKWVFYGCDHLQGFLITPETSSTPTATGITDNGPAYPYTDNPALAPIDEQTETQQKPTQFYQGEYFHTTGADVRGLLLDNPMYNLNKKGHKALIWNGPSEEFVITYMTPVCGTEDSAGGNRYVLSGGNTEIMRFEPTCCAGIKKAFAIEISHNNMNEPPEGDLHFDDGCFFNTKISYITCFGDPEIGLFFDKTETGYNCVNIYIHKGAFAYARMSGIYIDRLAGIGEHAFACAQFNSSYIYSRPTQYFHIEGIPYSINQYRINQEPNATESGFYWYPGYTLSGNGIWYHSCFAYLKDYQQLFVNGEFDIPYYTGGNSAKAIDSSEYEIVATTVLQTSDASERKSIYAPGG